MNLNVLRNLSYGVYVVSTMDQERPTGCIANSIMQITSAPVTVALSMNHDNYTNSCIQASGVFAVSILTVDSDPGLIGRFGFQSGKDHDKFDGLASEMADGLPVILDSCGYMTFKVIDSVETSTHTIFIGEMTDCSVIGNAEPMTYSYYHKVVKGKSPKNAPTYIPTIDGNETVSDTDNVSDASSDAFEKKSVYKCSVCGYEYDGDIPFNELPEDYVCPICKQPKSVFVKLG